MNKQDKLYIARIVNEIDADPHANIRKDWIAKLVHVQQQIFTAEKTGYITCECKIRGPLYTMFRCLYCGEWFCPTCAEIHFGQTRAEYDVEHCHGAG